MKMAFRAAYVLLILSAPVYFYSKGGQVSAPVCAWTFDAALARHSLTNYPHIVLFSIFFVLTYVQLHRVRNAMMWSAAATLAIALVSKLRRR